MQKCFSENHEHKHYESNKKKNEQEPYRAYAIRVEQGEHARFRTKTPVKSTEFSIAN